MVSEIEDINTSNKYARKAVEEMAKAAERAEAASLAVVSDLLDIPADTSAYWSRYKDEQKQIEKNVDKIIENSDGTSAYWSEFEVARNNFKNNQEEKRTEEDAKDGNQDGGANEEWINNIAGQLGIDTTGKSYREVLEEVSKIYNISNTYTKVLTIDDFFNYILELDKMLADEKWTYGTHGSGNAKNFEEVLNNMNHQLQCGSSVNLALYLSGYMTVEQLTNQWGGFNPHGVEDVHRVVSTEIGDQKTGVIDERHELEKGDILFVKTGAEGWGHIEVVDRVDEDGNVWVYSTGDNYGIRTHGSTCAGKISNDYGKKFEAYRLENNRKVETVKSDDQLFEDIVNAVSKDLRNGGSLEETGIQYDTNLRNQGVQEETDYMDDKKTKPNEENTGAAIPQGSGAGGGSGEVLPNVSETRFFEPPTGALRLLQEEGFSDLVMTCRKDGVRVLSGKRPDGTEFSNLVVVGGDIKNSTVNPDGKYQRGDEVTTNEGPGIMIDYSGMSANVRRETGKEHFNIAQKKSDESGNEVYTVEDKKED